MLKDIGDWYRVIDPILSDERLEQRIDAASTLFETWQSAQPDVLLAAVALMVELTHGAKNLSNAALTAVTDAIVASQPSFDRKAEAASTDIRICAAVAISETIQQAKLKTGLRSRGVLLAACVVSSLRFRHLTCSRALSDQLQRLLWDAQELLRTVDGRRRRRLKEPLLDLSEVPVDFAKAKDQYEAAFAILEEEILKDREELQALWWVFGGYSISTFEKYADIKVGVGLLAGHELASILSSPPTIGMAALASRMVRSAHGANKQIALAKLFAEVSKEVVAIIVSKGAAVELVRHGQDVFPLLSCVLRSFEGETDVAQIVRGAQNWRSKLTLGGEELAEQFYFENSLVELLVGA